MADFKAHSLSRVKCFKFIFDKISRDNIIDSIHFIEKNLSVKGRDSCLSKIVIRFKMIINKTVDNQNVV